MAPKKAAASEEVPLSPPPPAVEHKCGELKLPVREARTETAMNNEWCIHDVLQSGAVYVGEYRPVDGVKEYHGKGILTQGTQGEMQCHSGRGTLFVCSHVGCEVLEGEWSEGDLLHGRYAFQSGASYEGQFYQNAFHGQVRCMQQTPPHTSDVSLCVCRGCTRGLKGGLTRAPSPMARCTAGGD